MRHNTICGHGRISARKKARATNCCFVLLFSGDNGQYIQRGESFITQSHTPFTPHNSTRLTDFFFQLTNFSGIKYKAINAAARIAFIRIKTAKQQKSQKHQRQSARQRYQRDAHTGLIQFKLFSVFFFFLANSSPSSFLRWLNT